ncbi:MAG: hypothetical protein LBS19_06010 [Clostridiales bacterium]|jgi:cobalamin biosynthesis Mg chelatase CobN|nr:hypothetical protein [Clostridiales bacterium]
MKRNTSRAEFNEYAQYSGELRELEKEILEYAEQNRHTKNFCANHIWYGNFKIRLCKLVGWSAKDKRLNSEKAYDAVYDYLYNLLPDCNHESICW